MKGAGDLLLVPVLLALSGMAGSSDLASVSSGDIRYGIDTALFDYTGTGTLGMEVYQQLDLDQFSIDQDSVASFTTAVFLISSTGDTTAGDIWNTETDWLPGRSVVNSTVLPVVPGDYVLSVTVTDTGNGQVGTIARDMTVEPVGTLSDIELARAVVPSPDGSTNPLRKGLHLVYPAADGRFTLPAEHRAFYYIEAYGLDGNVLSFQARLETSSGEVIFARPWTDVSIPEGSSTVGFVDSLDLNAARHSGLHRLVFAVIAEGDTLEAEKYLVVARTTETGTAGPAQVAGEEAELLYPDEFRLILSSSERTLFDSLDEQARSRFYEAYWQGSPEQRLAFEQRCREAERYSNPFSEGWQTDRGRVYIIYGPPDDIDSVLFEGATVPHETWYYFGGGNPRFVFADRSGTGRYEQIYSNVEGEISYSNWQRMLSPISGTAGGGE